MIDLSEAGVVDFHAHMSIPIGLGELIRRDVAAQSSLFKGTPARSHRWDDLAEVSDLDQAFEQWAHPLNAQYRMLLHYISRVLGCAPDDDAVDQRLLPAIGEDFEAYVRSVLDRERIDLVVRLARKYGSTTSRDRSIWLKPLWM